MKKILILISILSFSACSTVNETAGNVKNKLGQLKPNISTCPEKSERTLADILCREPK